MAFFSKFLEKLKKMIGHIQKSGFLTPTGQNLGGITFALTKMGLSHTTVSDGTHTIIGGMSN